MLASRSGPGLENTAMSPSTPEIGPTVPAGTVHCRRVFDAATLIAAAEAAGEPTMNRRSSAFMSVNTLLVAGASCSMGIHMCTSRGCPDALIIAMTQRTWPIASPGTAGVVAVAACGHCVVSNVTWKLKSPLTESDSDDLT